MLLFIGMSDCLMQPLLILFKGSFSEWVDECMQAFWMGNVGRQKCVFLGVTVCQFWVFRYCYMLYKSFKSCSVVLGKVEAYFEVFLIFLEKKVKHKQ